MLEQKTAGTGPPTLTPALTSSEDPDRAEVTAGGVRHESLQSGEGEDDGRFVTGSSSSLQGGTVPSALHPKVL